MNRTLAAADGDDPDAADDDHAGPNDLRLPVLGALAWGTALVSRGMSHVPASAMVVVGAAVAVVVASGMVRRTATVVGWTLIGVAVASGVLLRSEAVRASPVTALARDRASVHAVVTVGSDPRIVHGRFGNLTMLRVTLREVTGRGQRHLVRAPALLFGPAGGDGRPWAAARFGSRLAVAGRLAPSDDPALTSLITVRGPPVTLAGPGAVQRAVARVRTGVADAVSGQSTDARALVPALVDGDESRIAADLKDDFRATGLTHLLAVSGTNLTLVVGFVLVVARGVGVRARGLIVVGCLGVVAFVLLARAEPSVLRAAAMGSVALLGMGAHGRRRGVRALGACVVALMLVDPGLATSAGFALSVLATAGILFLAPTWRDALRRWLPRWAAEAIAVPCAAQVVCTPLIAALSGQVSLVAVGANLAAAPTVAPATVLGLTGGLASVIWAPLGRVVGVPAGWSADWIALVARHAADLPVANEPVPTGPVDLALLTLGCLVLALVLGRILARRRVTLWLGALLVVVILVPAPSFGWSPRGW